ncbi:methyltransferase-like protein 22 isoform X2 [Ovis canadensis]|uniref:methyltransferase-like protein 22 isoform X2 n=1 Tax=Ovis canadensis TaxID=37174 RepID=UPI0037500642
MRHLLCFDESPHMVFTAPLGRGSDEEVTGSRPCSMGPVREVLNPCGPSPQAGLQPPQPCSSAKRSSDLNLFTEIQSPGGAWGPRDESEVAQSCPILCNPMDYSLQRSSIHEIFQIKNWNPKRKQKRQGWNLGCWISSHLPFPLACDSEHTMATPLEDVGKQVWRGALLLADYILFQRDLFQGRTVLELGAGTGLASIIAATVAQTVYCTDVGADLLAMCQRNIALNSHLLASGGGVVKVKELDWLRDDLCTDPEVPFSWSKEDISHLYSHTTILLAAEVFYDDDLTDAVFKTLSRLAHKLKNACTAILSVEKRLNFTLRHLDVTCEAYDHFRTWLQRLEGLAGGRLRFAVEPVDATFPQLLVYERIQQLELWKIFVEPVTDPTVSVDTASQPFS